MSPPTDDEVQRYINEIVKGVHNIEDKLEDDVVRMCDLLLLLIEECKKRPRPLPESVKQHFEDIYWSSKLHLDFHFRRDAVNLKKFKEVGEILGLGTDDRRRRPGIECAMDPGSKLLEIISELAIADRLTKEHAEEVMKMTKVWLRFLDNPEKKTRRERKVHNIFRPAVLAKVSRGVNKKKGCYAVGSTVAVSHFLKPLYLYNRISHFKQSLKKAVIYNKPLKTAEENAIWESKAFWKGGYEDLKHPCQTCKSMFQNLPGFDNSASTPHEIPHENSLAQCAEYSPINQLLPLDPQTTSKDNITPELNAALRQFRGKCLFLYENFGSIAQKCKEADESGDNNERRRAYEDHVKDKVHIFGIKPELNGSLGP